MLAYIACERRGACTMVVAATTVAWSSGFADLMLPFALVLGWCAYEIWQLRK